MNALLYFLTGVLLSMSLSICAAPTLPEVNDLPKWYLVNALLFDQDQEVQA